LIGVNVLVKNFQLVAMVEKERHLTLQLLFIFLRLYKQSQEKALFVMREQMNVLALNKDTYAI